MDDRMTNLVNAVDKSLYNIWFKYWFQLLDNSLSHLVLTSDAVKKEESILLKLERHVKFLTWFIPTVLMTPLGVCVYLIWLLIFRKFLRAQPFQISSIKKETNSINELEKNFKLNYEILSINVCFLPETISKRNNLKSMESRMQNIASILTKSSPKIQNSNGSQSNANNIRVIDDITSHTDLDFVCFQEVWSIDTAHKLKDILHEKFEHIAYDAGESTLWESKGIGFESGLMIASKYPIVSAQFKPFSMRVGNCALTTKGLLIVKVSLGKCDKMGKHLIGYISNAHLQSYQEKLQVHSSQLNEIHVWLKHFKEKTCNQNKEHCLFDVICGDFNIDNMSPVDKISYENLLFKVYKDPLMVKPGLDHPSAIGTEMRFYSIYDDWTSTPQKFREALENERLRRLLILDANIECANEEMCKKMPEIDTKDGLPVKLPVYGGARRVDS